MRRCSQTSVTISKRAQADLCDDIYQRREIEACGLLTGSIDEHGHWHVEQAHPLQNIFHSPVYFEFAPEEMLAVELAYPEQVIGAYHSHPTGFASASNTDRQNMERVNKEQHIPWVWLIICGPFTAMVSSTEAAQQGVIPPARILAYHHYEREGLQRIAVHIEE